MGGLLKSLSFGIGFFMSIYNTRNTAALVMTNLYFKETTNINMKKSYKGRPIDIDNDEDFDGLGTNDYPKKPRVD
jgi:hypothetical protein